MKKFALAMLLVLTCVIGIASAYVLNIDCPQNLPVGAPLPVTGTTTFPVGTTFDITFSSSGQVSHMISSVPVTVGDDKGFSVVFETTGLAGGMYKVEAVPRGDYQSKLSSDSTTIKVVNLIDRSDMLHVTSKTNQVIPQALSIEGYISKAGSTGVKLEVTGPSGKVFGPTYIATTTRGGNDDGYFSQYIPVSDEGNYYAKFSDSTGYIGQKIFGVTGPVTTVTAITPEETLLITPTATTPRPTTMKTPVPAQTTKAGIPLFGIIAGLSIAGLLASRKLR